MQNEDHLKKLQFLKKQFLYNVPVKELIWKDFSDLNVELQEQIIKHTIRFEAVLKYPVNINYQKAFVKSLLQYLEKQGSVIQDILYEEYGRLVALQSTTVNFKHYPLENCTRNIILKEDIRLISDGTTGLRTWQAALALSEWVLSNTACFHSKIILELGSGIGLTGLVISMLCTPQAVYLSDCHPSVLTTLCDNISFNINSDGDKNGNISVKCLPERLVDCDKVSVLNLAWEDISPEFCQRLGHVDQIVAADVVYDNSLFKPLVSAVDNLFNYCGTEQFILSCTERNGETLNAFIQLLGQRYKVCDFAVPPQRNFLWPETPPVKIFNITHQ
jgi:predicted nicotinamide N-methyase